MEDAIQNREVVDFFNLCFLEIEKDNKVVNYIYMNKERRSSLLSFLGMYFGSDPFGIYCGEDNVGDYHFDARLWTAKIIGDDDCRDQVVFSTSKLNIKEVI